MADTEKNVSGQEKETGGKKKKPVMVALVILFLVLAAAAGTYFFLFSGGDAAENGEIPISEVRKLTLESFTVNLADPGSKRYARVTVTLEYVEKKLDKELAQKSHRVKDLFLEMLRENKVSDLDTTEEMNVLKNTIMDSLNSMLEEGNVTGVYFEEFLIQ